jgi:Leucine-rich repeat (LRR) protein
MFNITEYLDSLPDTIRSIDVSIRDLEYIPSLSRFKNLQILECSFNDLHCLPSLPKTLKILICGENVLTSLPELPEGLLILDCKHNLLSKLPRLPKSLIKLICNNNVLCELPFLNDKLNTLVCSTNLLKDIPQLPKSLKYLDCTNNTYLYSIYPKLNIDIINVVNLFKNSKKEILETSAKISMRPSRIQRLIDNKAIDIEEITMDYV